MLYFGSFRLFPFIEKFVRWRKIVPHCGVEFTSLWICASTNLKHVWQQRGWRHCDECLMIVERPNANYTGFFSCQLRGTQWSPNRRLWLWSPFALILAGMKGAVPQDMRHPQGYAIWQHYTRDTLASFPSLVPTFKSLQTSTGHIWRCPPLVEQVDLQAGFSVFAAGVYSSSFPPLLGIWSQHLSVMCFRYIWEGSSGGYKLLHRAAQWIWRWGEKNWNCLWQQDICPFAVLEMIYLHGTCSLISGNCKKKFCALTKKCCGQVKNLFCLPICFNPRKNPFLCDNHWIQQSERRICTRGRVIVNLSFQVAIDIEFARNMYELHRKVNPQEIIVGW